MCASLDKHNEKLALLWRTPCWTRLAGNKEVTRTSPDGECSALRGEGRGGCRSNGEKRVNSVEILLARANSS